jgi:ribonuclease VapC
VIALDSSALIAIVRNEVDAQQFLDALMGNPCIIGAPTRLETYIVLRAHGSEAEQQELVRPLAHATLRVVPFTELHAGTASEAFRKYGKGQGHPAQLNFGDCMTYAVAKLASAPLLYKGGDFAHTDILSALTP